MQSAPVDDVTSGYVLALPTAISELEVGRYAAILRLSPEQSASVKAFWLKYMADWQALDNKDLASLRRLAHETKRQVDMFDYTRDSVIALGQLEDAQGRLAKKYTLVDETLFDAILPILTEEQVERVPQVRLHRERFRCHGIPIELPAAGIDLAWTVETAELPAYAITAELESVLNEYQEAVTPLMIQVRDGLSERCQQQAVLLNQVLFDEIDQHRDFKEPVHKERARHYREQCEVLLAQSARLQKRIVTMNRNFAPRIAMQLPPLAGAEFLMNYRRMAYPLVYRDPLDPEALYTAIMALPGLDKEHRAVVEAMWQVHQQSYAGICRKMEEASDEFQETVARTMTSVGRDDFELTMRQQRDKRWRSSNEFVDRVKSALSPEMLLPVSELIADYNRRFEIVQRMAAETRYP